MKIELVRGDITERPFDAIVNAANTWLIPGGGVDGAIHRAGGPSILEACKRVITEKYPGGLTTGQAVATTAGQTAGEMGDSCGRPDLFARWSTGPSS